MQMRTSDWFFLLALSVLWGASFFFVGVAVKDIPPLTLVTLRVAIASALLLPLALSLGHQLPRDLAGWKPYVVMGLLTNVLPFTLIAAGQTRIGSGLASVLNATTPLFALIIAHVLTADEKLGALKLAGVFTGIIGVAILIGPAALAGSDTSVLGMILILGAAICYGFSAYWGGRLRKMPPMVSATCQLLSSAIVLAPICLWYDQPWSLPAPGPAAIWSVLGLATLSTALAYLLFFHILSGSGGTNVMLVTLLIPVSAIFLGSLFLDERLAGHQIAGALIIGFSLLIIDRRLPGLNAQRLPKPTD